MVDSYERAREKKIAANKERMRALGVDVLAASVRKSRASPRPKVSKSAAVTFRNNKHKLLNKWCCLD